MVEIDTEGDRKIVNEGPPSIWRPAASSRVDSRPDAYDAAALHRFRLPVLFHR